jgi:hypothetical protein
MFKKWDEALKYLSINDLKFKKKGVAKATPFSKNITCLTTHQFWHI